MLLSFLFYFILFLIFLFNVCIHVYCRNFAMGKVDTGSFGALSLILIVLYLLCNPTCLCSLVTYCLC